MGMRTFLPGFMVLQRKPKALHLRFFPQGAGNPTVAAADSKGVASVVRNGSAGEWLITLQDSYKRLLSAQMTIQMSASTDLTPQVATVANLGSSTAATTIIVRALAAATPTDIAANLNNSVMLSLYFDDADS